MSLHLGTVCNSFTFDAPNIWNDLHDNVWNATSLASFIYLFVYLGFYVAFNTVQVISRRVVGRAEETGTYILSGFCTVNCRPTASNYQLSHLRLCRELNPGLRGGRRECSHSATVAPLASFKKELKTYMSAKSLSTLVHPTTPVSSLACHTYVNGPTTVQYGYILLHLGVC